MRSIIRTEWLKIRGYRAFWWLMGITVLTYPAINYMFTYVYQDITNSKKRASGDVLKMLLGNPFSFPEAWKTVAYFSSFFVYIPAIVVIMLITNEYNYKTNRQNIIDGWSRKDFMKAKLVDVIILSLLVTAIYAVIAFIIGTTYTTDPAASRFQTIHYIGLFALQTFSQLSIAFVVGFLVRKSFIALGIFIFYGLFLDPILYLYLREKFKLGIGEFFPMQISNFLIPHPAFIGRLDEKAYQAKLSAINPHIGYTILLLLITWGFCFWLNNRRDL
jgi:ABC-2 type transport system permease protein